MEYSLRNLNKIAQVKNVTLNNFVETLNLIGLEVDDTVFDMSSNKVNLNDIKLDLKIPANRDDLLNENILNEELSTIFLFKIYKTWQHLQEKYFFLLKQKYNSFSNYTIAEIDSDTKGILSYGVKITKIENEKVPTWLNKKLLNIDNKQTNIIESIINLVIYEWGQNFNILPCTTTPLKIERLKTQENYIVEDEIFLLKKGSIVLKDGEGKIVSVLGIVQSKRKKEAILLEASFYDINNNILLLNDVNTKVSFRYLRRMFLMDFKTAFQRLLTLVEIIAAGEIDLTIFKNQPKQLKLQTTKVLKINKRSFKNILNIDNYDLSVFEKSNLKIISTTPQSIYLRIPDSRKDLTREIDLIEEYARFIGYENFEDILPDVTYEPKLNNKTRKIEKIKQFLLNHNFNEIFTNSLVSESKYLSESILIKNPLNSDLALLRNSLVPNILDIYPKNLRFGIDYLKFFEVGRVYKQKNNKVYENEVLAFSFPIQNSNINSKISFFKAKSFIEQLLLNFNDMDFTLKQDIKENSYYHPKKHLSIYLEDQIVGNCGEIHPRYKKLFNLKQNLYALELNLDYIKNHNLKSKIRIYKDYSKYPIITKDLSLTLEQDINFNDLKNFIQMDLTDLKSIKFFDVYFEQNLTNRLNLGIRLEFQSFHKTLLAEEIDQNLENLIIKLKKNFRCERKI